MYGESHSIFVIMVGSVGEMTFCFLHKYPVFLQKIMGVFNLGFNISLVPIKAEIEYCSSYPIGELIAAVRCLTARSNLGRSQAPDVGSSNLSDSCWSPS